MEFLKSNIWFIAFFIWGLPLGYYRSKFRKIVYQTNDWKINILPWFWRELKGLLFNLYPKDTSYLKMRNFYRFYLVVYSLLFCLYIAFS